MDRVLVAYGSKYGATAEIAEAIGTVLGEQGFDVDVRPAADVRSVDDYRAVILGSAVYMKRWRPAARRLLRQHSEALAARDVWLFNSGGVGPSAEDDSEEALRWTRPAKIRKLGELVGVHDNVVFGGRIAEDGGFLRRNMAKNTPEATRDCRNWDQITTWAHGIAATLAQTGSR